MAINNFSSSEIALQLKHYLLTTFEPGSMMFDSEMEERPLEKSPLPPKKSASPPQEPPRLAATPRPPLRAAREEALPPLPQIHPLDEEEPLHLIDESPRHLNGSQKVTEERPRQENPSKVALKAEPEASPVPAPLMKTQEEERLPLKALSAPSPNLREERDQKSRRLSLAKPQEPSLHFEQTPLKEKIEALFPSFGMKPLLLIVKEEEIALSENFFEAIRSKLYPCRRLVLNRERKSTPFLALIGTEESLKEFIQKEALGEPKRLSFQGWSELLESQEQKRKLWKALTELVAS